MPRKYYRKPHRIKRKKPVWKNRFFGLGFLVLIMFGAGFYFIFFSGFFQLKNINVAGGKSVSGEYIKSFIVKNNIFLINTEEIKKNILEKLPQLAGVEIRRRLPAALNIVVKEREAIVLWCEAENCFLADKEGVVFGEAPPETDLIKISGKKELMAKESIARLLEISSKLKERLNILASKALFISEERLNVETSDGWAIYFNLKGDIEWQLTELSSVLEKQIPPEKRGSLEYIDLRFSRVYFKYFERK